ncbi:MAG: hypothetical protein ACE5OY_05995, partial [Candidatus Bathyarchaeia archaeon]
MYKYDQARPKFGDGYVQKCLPLNILRPTKVKRRLLRETYRTFLQMVREALAVNGVGSRAELHNQTYEKLRGRYGV